jgi:topoisomerase IA-like protein
MNVRVIGTNESIMINCSDYDLTKHIFHTKDKIVVKDQHDNMHQVSLDDTRYISGELVPIHKDIAYGWNSLGEKIKTTTGDIRFKTGELKGNNRDKFWITNGKENAMINKNDSIPDGYYKGRIQKISTNIDMIYINDGNKNIKIPKSESIPEGWSRGMTKGTRKRLIYITDGKINKKIPPEDEIPEGFRAGMAPKKKLK